MRPGTGCGLPARVCTSLVCIGGSPCGNYVFLHRGVVVDTVRCSYGSMKPGGSVNSTWSVPAPVWTSRIGGVGQIQLSSVYSSYLSPTPISSVVGTADQCVHTSCICISVHVLCICLRAHHIHTGVCFRLSSVRPSVFIVIFIVIRCDAMCSSHPKIV